MKKIALLLVLISSSFFAQEKKYQSLLWEISGNGLQKKSYVYGSMHVSDKVSYHLSDAFFTHLQNADIIANESEPRTWTELFDLFSFYSNYANRGSFYTNFYINPLEKDDLYSLFRSTNYNLESLLTRTNEMNKEYQEETYLDMFIYRTGRKYNKKTVGLEDVKTSTLNIMKAQANMDQTEVDKNRQAILKLLKNKSYDEALTDFYREKDLDMIDSLSNLSSPQAYLKAMLFDRNIVMVKSMDSIMKTGSLFSAIGAAHLPGQNGVIELLRKKGYTVTPIFDAYTDKGKNSKKQIEEYFTKPELKTKTTADKTISIPLFEVVLETGEDLESPDLVNGGFINVKRNVLKDFLNKNNKAFNPKTLDSLFYENIPGDILEKKAYKEKNYWVYDIKNKTKTGNAQHYRYYITPLEIIAVIMGGEGDYVRKYEEEVYSKIIIKSGGENWETITPRKGNFEVQFPSYFSYSGNKENLKDNTDMSIFGYEEKDNSHYFLLEKTLQENDNLEDSEFELKRIHYEFYTQHEIDSTETKFNKEHFIFTSKSKLGDKKIALQSLLKGNKYYLLGTVNASEANTSKFFSSFQLKPSIATEEYKTYSDSIAHFSIEIPKKQNEHLDFLIERDYNIGAKKKNHFVSKNKNYQFLGANGSIVELSFYQYHKYETEKSIDSIWKGYKKQITKDYKNNYLDAGLDDVAISVIDADISLDKENDALDYAISDWDETLFGKQDEKLTILSEKKSEDKNKKTYTFEALVSKKDSKQAIKHKAVFKDGTFYTLKTLVDKNYNNDDAFVEKTFNSLTLKDTTFTESVFDNKLDLFLTDVRSKHDSIRYSALKSIHYLSVEKEDLPKFKTFLSTFKFKDDETEILGELYEKIGRIKSPEIIPYLESIYKKENVNTVIQFAVLRALTFQESKEGYKKIQELLEYDLPISDDEYEITSLFRYFEDDLENSQVLFPDIFQFYSIKEYHTPIVDFTDNLLKENLGNSKKLKSFKKMILTNAKLEYKRLSSWKNKQDIKDEDEEDYYEDMYAPSSDFISYIHILYPFKNEKDIAQLFEKAGKLDIEEVNIAFAKVQLEKTHNLDEATANSMIGNEKTKFAAFQMLYHTKQNSYLEKFDNNAIAEAAIIYFENIDAKKDSISFYQTKDVVYNGKKITYYFFKKLKIDEDDYNTKQEKVTGIAFINDGNKLNLKGYYKLTPKTFLEEKDINPIINAAIDESLNNNHSRAFHGKIKDAFQMYDEEMYMEEGDY